MRGCAGIEDRPQYQQGRTLIEWMAASTLGHAVPVIRLSAEDCADVLNFMSSSEPIDSDRWMTEADGEPSHIVGQMLILECIEDAMRRLANGPMAWVDHEQPKAARPH
jgi:hypothetical protein